MRSLYENRFLRGLVLVALVSLAIVLLSLENSLATASALLSIAFFLAIAFFLFLLWRERRSDIEALNHGFASVTALNPTATVDGKLKKFKFLAKFPFN